jgi:hypothetical protein
LEALQGAAGHNVQEHGRENGIQYYCDISAILAVVVSYKHLLP